MQVSFAHLIERNARLQPNRVAISCDGRETTWSQLAMRCSGVAAGLEALGLKAGDRVGFLGLNSDWFYECYFAPAFAGFELVALNYRLAKAEMLACLEDCDAKALICDAQFAETARRLVAALGRDVHLVVAGGAVGSGELDYEAMALSGATPKHPASSGDGINTYKGKFCIAN